MRVTKAVSRLSIAVLLGGTSAEREVSLRSGAAVSRALRGLGHGVTEVDPVPGDLRLPEGIDLAFLALHGTYGEDGGVQAELEEAGVPYTGCGVAASLFAFDKVITKRRCVRAGVPTPDFRVFHAPPVAWPEGMTEPAVVKPTRQGSSVGLHFVEERRGLEAAVNAALRHGGEVVMEPRIRGRETTVALLGGRALPVVEVRPRSGEYSYASKYTPGATEYECPASLDEGTTRRVQEAALGAFRAVGGRDYGRVDVMLDAEGRPWVLEVNTLPGMTETSLFPKAAAAAGLTFPEVCQRMVELAWDRSGGRER